MTRELELARECFLSMIAEARTWRENVDGDTDNNGRTVMYIDYDLNIRHSDLAELANALGIQAAWDETIKDAIDRELALPARTDLSTRPPSPSVLAPVVLLADAAPESAGLREEVQADPLRSVSSGERR